MFLPYICIWTPAVSVHANILHVTCKKPVPDTLLVIITFPMGTSKQACYAIIVSAMVRWLERATHSVLESHVDLKEHQPEQSSMLFVNRHTELLLNTLSNPFLFLPLNCKAHLCVGDLDWPAHDLEGMGGAGADSAGGPPTSRGLRCSNTLLVSIACPRPKCGRVAGSTTGTQRESVAFSDVFILFHSFTHATVACCYTSCQTGMLLWSHLKYPLTRCYLFCFSDLVLGSSEEFCPFSMAAETCPGLARALNWQEFWAHTQQPVQQT